jgi:hypothetical protein
MPKATPNGGEPCANLNLALGEKREKGKKKRRGG